MGDLHWTNAKELEFLLHKNEYKSVLDLFHANKVPSVIVDVGANNGMFALQCVERWPEGVSVYAFEPFAEPFKCLEENTAKCNTKTSRIVPLKLAVGCETGPKSGTYLPNYSLLSGFHVSENDKRELEKLAGRDLSHEFSASSQVVDCVRLDSWLDSQGLSFIDLLKVDVEKSELDVLLSLADHLRHKVGFVICEVHECTRLQVVELLKNCGFAKVSISDPNPPTYCLFSGGVSTANVTSQSYDPDLNTYLVWAAKNT